MLTWLHCFGLPKVISFELLLSTSTSVRHLGVFRAWMYLWKLGIYIHPLHMQNPSPLQPDFPRILQATSVLSWNQLQRPLWTTVTTLKRCPWNWGSKVCWAWAQGLSVDDHRNNRLQNNAIHNLEGMKDGKDKTARVQLSIATTWKG